MSASWNDLSNEIRKIIIEYIVADTTVTFVPRHAATRGTRKKDEAKAQEPAHFPLLLVSKQFLTYAELNDAVLKNATIKYQRARELTALDTRFGKGGIESIRSLHLSINGPLNSGARQIDIPSRLQNRLKCLQKMTIYLKHASSWIGRGTSKADLIRVAKGQHVTPHVSPTFAWRLTSTESVRDYLRHILFYLACNFSERPGARMIGFLRATPEASFEKIIQFRLTGIEHPTGHVFNEPVEFTSALQCCRFIEHPSVIMPQRFDQSFVNTYPWLAAINEIELDKYYTS